MDLAAANLDHTGALVQMANGPSLDGRQAGEPNVGIDRRGVAHEVEKWGVVVAVAVGRTLAQADLARISSVKFHSYDVEANLQVAVVAADIEQLEQFVDTYGGILEIEPLLLKKNHLTNLNGPFDNTG